MSKRVSEPAPWYAPPSKRESKTMDAVTKATHILFVDTTGYLHLLRSLSGVLVGMGFAGAAGVLAVLAFWPEIPGWVRGVLVLAMLLCVLIATVQLLRQCGIAVQRTLHDLEGAPVRLGVSALRGDLGKERQRSVIPAPELALQQLIHQVRNYAQEKSFQASRSPNAADGLVSPADILRRRWNEVMDSVNEFEIFLACDPTTLIDKFIAKSPPQSMDVSRIFRDVADSFDSTWRRKGINIESAIVTPLRATTHENLLRRLLIGPWRTSVYFARRGSGVVFSARSINGNVIASWECDGLAIPDAYVARIQDTSLSVSQRIEEGMAVLAPDPAASPNTFHALVSFTTWIDLAKACGADYSLKHTSDGFVIELRLS